MHFIVLYTKKKKFFRMVTKNYKGEKQPEFRNITAIFKPYTTRIWEYVFFLQLL